MALYTIPQRIKHRRGTYTELYQRNEILLDGEECFETHDVDGNPQDPQLCKVGDGVTPWNDLEYQSTGDGGGVTPDPVAACLGATFDGGGEELVVGSQGSIKVLWDCTITGWTMLADQTGDAVVDVWKDTLGNYPPSDADSITASAPPELASQAGATSTTLTGWTTALSAGDILRFNVDSCADITWLALQIEVER